MFFINGLIKWYNMLPQGSLFYRNFVRPLNMNHSSASWSILIPIGTCSIAGMRIYDMNAFVQNYGDHGSQTGKTKHLILMTTSNLQLTNIVHVQSE